MVRESPQKQNGLHPMVNIMLIAPAKIPGRVGASHQPALTSSHQTICHTFIVLSTQWMKEMRTWGWSS